MKTLVEIKDTILYEVHCHRCGAMLGYFLEADNLPPNELSEMKAR